MNNHLHPTIQSIIANIKSTRKQKGYSQDYMALKLGITQNAYSKIELGKTLIAISKLYNITTILEIDVIQLLEAEDWSLVISSAKLPMTNDNEVE